MKALRRVIVLVLLLLLPSVALACEQCLGTGGANGPVIRALVFSMAALLSIVGFVGVGIATFFINTVRRSRSLAPSDLEVTEQGELAMRTAV